MQLVLELLEQTARQRLGPTLSSRPRPGQRAHLARFSLQPNDTRKYVRQGLLVRELLYIIPVSTRRSELLIEDFATRERGVSLVALVSPHGRPMCDPLVVNPGFHGCLQNYVRVTWELHQGAPHISITRVNLLPDLSAGQARIEEVVLSTSPADRRLPSYLGAFRDVAVWAAKAAVEDTLPLHLFQRRLCAEEQPRSIGSVIATPDGSVTFTHTKHHT